MDKKHLGMAFVVIAALLWAFESFFAKLAYKGNADFLQTTALRSVIVVIVALAYILFTRSSFKVSKKEFSAVFVMAIIGTVFADVLYFYCLTKIPVVNALLIAHLQPIFVVLLAFIFLREEKLTAYEYIGIALLVIAGIVTTSGSFGNLMGFRFGTIFDWLIIFSTIAWAATVILARKYLTSLSSGVIVFYRFLIAGIFVILIAFFNSSLGFTNIFQILVGLSVAVGLIFYYEGLKRIKGADASALESFAVFFAAILGFVFLNEGITLFSIFGIVLLFAGTYVLTLKSR